MAKLVKISEPFGDHVRITRYGGKVTTNVPWSVVLHSPDGFEFGYAGSGPADLALNILNAFVPPGRRGNRMKCYQGYCSRFAMRHHQDFKQHFIQGMPYEGATLWRKDILAWIDSRIDAPYLQRDEGTLHEVGTP